MKKYYSPYSLFNPRKLRSLLSFGVKGYLAEIGWIRAFEAKAPVDVDGNPIPWVTYSFIDFIKERIRKEHSVFEFGSGNSTLFYAKFAKNVVSVEHDKAWLDKIKATAPANSEMIYSELVYGGEYCRTPLNDGKKFDMIIVDGRDRVNCCKNSINALTANGVIVLDDSEREQYSEAVTFLLSKGFKHLSFSGISPGFFYRKSTSIFYKADNCLGI